MKRNWFLYLLCLIFAGIAVFSGYKIISTLREYKAGEDAYEELQQYLYIPEATKPSEKVDATEAPGGTEGTAPAEETVPLPRYEYEGPLVDFDALWGHRRNPEGYAQELEKFDVKLGELLPLLKEDDLLIITADHGNDPTHTGTDHTREKVPFIAYSPSLKDCGKLDDAQTFAVIGATIADNFGVKMPEGTIGSSVLENIR